MKRVRVFVLQCCIALKKYVIKNQVSTVNRTKLKTFTIKQSVYVLAWIHFFYYGKTWFCKKYPFENLITYLIIFICFDSKKSQGISFELCKKNISNIDKSTYIFISHCVALLVLHKLGEVIGLPGNLPVLYGKGLELFAYKYRRGAKHIYNGVTHLVTHIHLHNFTLANWKKKMLFDIWGHMDRILPFFDSQFVLKSINLLKSVNLR